MKIPLKQHSDFPMYVGYYFRDIFKVSIRDIKDQINSVKIGDFKIDPESLVIEDELFLPDIAYDFKFNNKNHVLGSLQGLSY